MCGIIGIVARNEFSVKDKLLASLQRLEYRGYDSCGYATAEGAVDKATGFISELIENCGTEQTRLAVSHTRWATHGGITEANAHPHFNEDKTVIVVHNGIIENYEEMKKEMIGGGCSFTSDTDSEVIAHFLGLRLKQGRKPDEAMKDFMKAAKGTFAVLWLEKGGKRLYAMKRDSPLVLGIVNGMHVLASDIYAFSDESNRAIFFEDDEYAVIDADGYSFGNSKGQVRKEIIKFEWSREEETKENYDHFMMKEIRDQPMVVGRLLNSFKTTQRDKLERFAGLVREAKRVVFLACGTSYHASLIGSYLLTKQGIEAHSVIASEFEHFLLVDKDTLVVPISQSGETMDVVSVLKGVKQTGAKVASIVNVPYSTVQRLSDMSVEILAGQEICVAATKSYTNQLITLFCLAREIGSNDIDFNTIPGKIKDTIDRNEEDIKKLAKSLYKKKDIFVLGRGISYPTAREMALKLKEIPYMHAEGMMAGELKHGTIALVEEGTPVICLIPNENPDMISSTKEVEARGARTIIVSNTNGELHMPQCSDAEFAIYAGLVGHLLSYYIARLRNCPIDKPRNLAKSVTVK
jgi:glucosamine--fructose-6-phosphate aminotransferase (isomerizing)